MSRSFLPDPALPLFPLQTVLFPEGLLELKIFETRYLDLMARCMREQAPFGVVALRSGAETAARGAAGAPVALFDVGTLAELIEVDSPETNILLIRCRGGQRFRLGATRQEADGLWVGAAQPLGDDPVVAPRVKRRLPRQRMRRMFASGLSTSISSARVPTSNSVTGAAVLLRASLPERSATTPNGTCSRMQRAIRSR